MFRCSWALYLLSILAVVLVACGYGKVESHNTLCKHQYALCTSAPCIPVPGDPTKAICFCVVEDGPSMSTVACNTLQPTVDEHGVSTVYSTFSLKQLAEGKKRMKCPSGTPWTSCLNKRCTVDPVDPKKAICTCDVMRKTGEWTTLGGNCDVSTCKTSYWSGATIADAESGNAFLAKIMGKESSMKWCPEQ